MPVPQLLPCVEEWTGRSRLCHYGRYSAIAFVPRCMGGGDGGRIAPSRRFAGARRVRAVIAGQDAITTSRAERCALPDPLCCRSGGRYNFTIDLTGAIFSRRAAPPSSSNSTMKTNSLILTGYCLPPRSTTRLCNDSATPSAVPAARSQHVVDDRYLDDVARGQACGDVAGAVVRACRSRTP